MKKVFLILNGTEEQADVNGAELPAGAKPVDLDTEDLGEDEEESDEEDEDEGEDEDSDDEKKSDDEDLDEDEG